MSDIKEILVPDVGGEDVEVIEICVAVGDTVQAETALVTVESDKASMDIPSPFDGEVSELLVSVGDKISQGTLLAKLVTGAAAQSESGTADLEENSAVDTGSNVDETNVIEVTVPDIGGDENVDVIDVLVAVGDTLDKEAGLITLETDKATMDVPAPHAGTVKSISVSVGDKVSQGSLVLLLEPTSQPQKDDVAAPRAQDQVSTTEVIEVVVPDIGEDGSVDVIDVLVSAGDTIEHEAGLITLETDKATMDVPSPSAGVIKSVEVNVGDKVSQGSLILMLETASSTATTATTPPAPASAPAPISSSTSARQPSDAPKPPPVPHHPSVGGQTKSGKAHASPSVRRLAREFGVDLAQVSGTGPKRRILKEDVQSWVKYELSRPKMTPGSSVGAGEGGLQVLAPPKVDFAKFGDVEEVPLTRIQKISGPNLHRNWVTIPHVTQFDEADITELETFRKQQNSLAEKKQLGVKITPLVFMMKAVADALKHYPIFNSSLSQSGESLIQKKYFHIGIAVDTPGGLVVPVVRDVDQKGVFDLSRELMELSKKARDGKLSATDMQGSCFTISSLGGIGGTAFTPIVNAPDVAILGVSKSEMKPKWDGNEFVPRLMLPLSLSYDHRVIDGAVAARFAVHLSSVLSDIRQILL